MITGIVAMSAVVAMFASCGKNADVPAVEPAYIKFEVASGTAVGFQRIDLFAFDGAGMLAGCWSCPGSEISVDLKPGKYTFVAWGNLPENHTLKPETPLCGQTHIDDMSLRVPNAGATVFAGRLSPVQVFDRIPGQTFQVLLERTAVNMTVDIGINDWSAIRNSGIDL